MAGRAVVTAGHRARALVRRGKRVFWETGRVVRGAPSVIVEGRILARRGDRVTLRSTSGRINSGVSFMVQAVGRQVALIGCKLVGPRIIKGWVTQGARRTFAA